MPVSRWLILEQLIRHAERAGLYTTTLHGNPLVVVLADPDGVRDTARVLPRGGPGVRCKGGHDHGSHLFVWHDEAAQFCSSRPAGPGSPGAVPGVPGGASDA